MKKVFVVSEYIYSAQNSTGYFWSKVIDKASLSFPVLKVVAPVPTEKGCEKNKASTVEYLDFNAVAFNKNNLRSRFFGQAHQCLNFSHRIIGSARRGDIVLSGTNPALLLILMPIIRFFLGFRWCLLVHDVFPENLVPAGILKKNSTSYRLLNILFNFVYSRADHIIVIGRDMKQLLEEKTGRKNNITVIQNWVSDQDVYPINRDDSEIINKLGWQDRVVFQFFGNIGRVQGIDNILDAIKLVRNPRAAFLFIGDGTAVESVKLFVNMHAGDNVAYIGPIDPSRKNLGLAACDVALITLEKGMLGLGVPSKAYFSMAADKPILAVMDCRAEVSCMIQEDAIGWSCAPSDPLALATLIDDICQRDLSCMKGHNRKILQEKYSEAIALDKFIACISAAKSF